MIPNQFKENAIKIENFSTSIFGSHYFTSSWLKRTDLTSKSLVDKIKHLHTKDLERDPVAKQINFILCFDIRHNEVYLIHSVDFVKLTEDERVSMFSDWWDFYIPRSVWFKSFCMLNSKDITILAAELNNR